MGIAEILLTYAAIAAILAVFGSAVALLTNLSLRSSTPLDVLPIGACVLVALLVPVTQFVPLGTGSLLVIAVGVVALLAGLVIKRRRPRLGEIANAGVSRTGIALAACLALGVGLLALIPTVLLGEASTIAYGNNDGWYFAALAEWFQDRTLGQTPTFSAEEPLSTMAVWSDRFQLPVGFELTAGFFQRLFGRESFQIVGILGAVAFPVFVIGWLSLLDAIKLQIGRLVPMIVVLAAASPLFVLMFADNYMAQLWGVALWPFAVAACVRFAHSATWRTAFVAILGIVAELSVYPSVLPWLALAVAGVLVAGAWKDGDGVATRLRSSFVRAAAMAAVLIAGTILVAPIQTIRTIDFVRFASTLGGGAPEAFAPAPTSGFLLGAIKGRQEALGSSGALLLATAAAFVVIALACAITAKPRSRRIALSVVIALVVATFVIHARYRASGFAYGIDKTLMTGGALLAGAALVAVALPTERRTQIIGGVTALLCACFVWVPVAAGHLDRTDSGFTGFRKADLELGRQLDRLPEGTVVLAEGTGEAPPRSFQFRLMSSYFGETVAQLEMEGLGSTSSYLTQPGLTPPGSPEWRPTRAWDYVVRAGPTPIRTARSAEWSSPSYALVRAPDLDVTFFGANWYAPERNPEGVMQWSAGPVEMLVANRLSKARRVRLTARIRSYRDIRVVTATVAGTQQTSRAPADAEGPVAFDLDVAPNSVTTVQLDSSPPASPGPAGDARLLAVAFRDVRVADHDRAGTPAR